MQVKKFEAKTMKEALQMIKRELGPDAIILNAKDHKKSFGLAGRGSIEVTAAISEKSLQKKKYAESRLPDNAREKFKNRSAKQQKTFIESTVAKYQQRHSTEGAGALAEERVQDRLTAAVTRTPRPLTGRRYIDIGDADSIESVSEKPVNGRRVDDILEQFAKTGSYVLEDAANKAMPMSRKSGISGGASGQASGDEVLSLRQEVDSLRALLTQLQQGGPKGPATQHPGADYGLPFELSGNFEKLQSAGVDVRYIVEILEKADKELTGMEKKKRSLIDAWVARYIMSHTSIVGGWVSPDENNRLHLFMGPAGHGKTASLVKVASQLALHEKKKVAIFSADTFKVGATDQLKIFAQILGIPFETAKHSVEFQNLMQRHGNCDAILVDYPGFALRDIAEIDQIRSLMPSREISRRTHLVVSCGTKDQDVYDICHRYQVTHFDDLLPTKIDESYAHGFLFNVQRKTEKPLYAFGVGPKIPEDMELATRERVLDLIYRITKKNV